MKYAKVLECLDAEGLIRFVQDVVRIDSVYDPGVPGADESRVTEFVSKFLRDEGFEVHHSMESVCLKCFPYTDLRNTQQSTCHWT